VTQDSHGSGAEAERAFDVPELEEDGAPEEEDELPEEAVPSVAKGLPETGSPPESEGGEEEDPGSKDPLWISALLEREVSRAAERDSSQDDEVEDPIPEAGSGEEEPADDEETRTGW
jgi:hypothetical protein